MSHTTISSQSLDRRHFLRFLGGAGSVWLLAACAAPGPEPSSPAAAETAVTAGPRRGGTLRLAFSEVPISFDPAFFGGYVDIIMGAAVYEALIWIDPTDPAQTLHPRLAESWEANDDQTSWTFKLRPGVEFHHGTPFTARDVVYTFERILDPALGSPAATIFPFIDGVVAVDDLTVRFDLSVSHAHLPKWLIAENYVHIEAHDSSPEQLSSHPSGTGPFRFVSYDPGSRTTLARNESYWHEELPYLDEVQHLYITDSNTQVAVLTSGDLDVMTQVGVANRANLEQAPGIDLVELPVGTYDVFALNCQMAPFDDVRVRQALKLTVDRPGLRQVVLGGKGELGSDHPFPPFGPFWDGTPSPERNIEKAKELLAAAGYPEGVEVTMITTDVSPGLVDASVALQEMAKAAGFNITLERVPPDSYWVDYYGQGQMYVSYWTTRVDPGAFLVLGFDPDGYYNEANWENPEMVGLLAEARETADEEALKDIYVRMQRLIQTDGGVIIPYFRPLVVAKRSQVQGMVPDVNIFDVRAAWLAGA